MADQVKQVHTDAGRLLVARAMVQGIAVTEALTHLAVGAGPVAFTGLTLKAPPRTGAVVQELGRTAFQERRYVVVDDGGPIVADRRYAASAVPTNLVYLRFRFLDAQAQGSWRQLGLYGGGVRFLERGATLIDDNPVGDDRANQQVVLSGGYSPVASQRITVTCTTGGGSGVARLGWVSDGSVGPGSDVAVAFNTPVPITGSGLALTFTGGTDAVLTQGARWEIRGTRSASSAAYAAGGVYDAISNPAGEVLADGVCFSLIHRDPAFVKGAAAIDIRLVCEVLSA